MRTNSLCQTSMEVLSNGMLQLLLHLLVLDSWCHWSAMMDEFCPHEMDGIFYPCGCESWICWQMHSCMESYYRPICSAFPVLFRWGGQRSRRRVVLSIQTGMTGAAMMTRFPVSMYEGEHRGDCRGVANHSRMAECTRLSPEGENSGVS